MRDSFLNLFLEIVGLEKYRVENLRFIEKKHNIDILLLSQSKAIYLLGRKLKILITRLETTSGTKFQKDYFGGTHFKREEGGIIRKDWTNFRKDYCCS